MHRRRMFVLALVGVLLGAIIAYAATRGGDSPVATAGPGSGAAGSDPLALSPTELAALARRLPTPRHENFYFVMTDRFANLDLSNDRGGASGDRLATGYDPTDKGFFHGGDLAGLEQRLDYLRALGMTAIWMTPPFVNRPVQGSGGDVSAGYHGYWITDFTRIDPHLGTHAEMRSLIEAAHAEGMRVYLDIITNHTADVIDYEQGEHRYISKADAPYKDAAGKAFDDAPLAGTPDFPTMTVASFPYTPVFRTEADASAKTPAWLNDRTLYHNRGDSTFEGESSTYGDFAGLDDLFTENPTVVDGMIAVYRKWVDLGIDGFRIDTVKHVDMTFWQRFAPAILEHARAAGKTDFFMFGEVYDTSPAAISAYTTTGRLPGALDFAFQSAAVDFASGHSVKGLHDLYAADDNYLDADSNAYELTTFLGNHDMGRIGYFLAAAADDSADLLRRDQLAMSLMYLARGQPVTYYGDEQGFIGSGGDKDARQDLFASEVEQYQTEPLVTGPSGGNDRHQVHTPLFEHIAGLTKLRAEHPALASGIQIERYAADGEGVYAFSRVERVSGVEYLVAVNNAAEPQAVTVTTASPGIRFDTVFGEMQTTTADATGALAITVPARAAVVLRAAAPIPPAAAAPRVTGLTLGSGGTLTGQAKVSAEVTSAAPAEVTFAARTAGQTDWTIFGTDDNPAYGLYVDAARLTPGDYEVVAVARTLDGKIGYASGRARVAP